MLNLVSVKKKVHNSSFKTEYDIVNGGAYIKLTILLLNWFPLFFVGILPTMGIYGMYL